MEAQGEHADSVQMCFITALCSSLFSFHHITADLSQESQRYTQSYQVISALMHWGKHPLLLLF